MFFSRILNTKRALILEIPDEIKLENKIKNDFCTTEFYMKFLQSCFMYETETTLSNYFKQNKIKA